jgi:hypothetical protein
MKRALLLVLAACHVDLEPPWQLDHDRILAVRVTPPHLAAGEVALVDALVAHAGGPTTIEAPRGITATDAPGGLFTAVNFSIDHWEIHGRDDAGLADARAELGLAADAPVPLELTVVITQTLVAKKVIWLGDSRANPDLPAVIVDGVPPGPALDVPIGRDIPASAIASDVSWFTSVGTLVDDDQPTATLYVAPEDPRSGEFAVVVRDDAGGVVWNVWPIEAHL